MSQTYTFQNVQKDHIIEAHFRKFWQVDLTFKNSQVDKEIYVIYSEIRDPGIPDLSQGGIIVTRINVIEIYNSDNRALNIETGINVVEVFNQDNEVENIETGINVVDEVLMENER